MNYRRIYEEFIKDRQLKQPTANYDEHHIVPRCLGGTDDPLNLVRLSRSDHFFAHLLLARIYGGKLATAALLMGSVCANAKVKISRRNFEWIRNEHIAAVSALQSFRMKDQEQRRSISEALKGRPKAKSSIAKRQAKRVYKWTPEMREAAAARARGRTVSTETRAKMSVAQKSRRHTAASRKKISLAAKADWQRRKNTACQ